MKRRTRIFASILALAAIAFAQFAVAAHACERMTASLAAGEDHSCCPNSERTPQCAQHCDHGFASLDSAKPAPAPVTAVGAFLGMVAAPATLGTAASIAYLVPPAAGPPPTPRLFALRI